MLIWNDTIQISLNVNNVNAGKKVAPRKRFQGKLPDLDGQTQQHNLIKNTVGKILNDEGENQMVFENISNSGMKIKIRRKTPVSRSYNETTITSYEIILITGNNAKYTSCDGKLNKGANEFLHNVDKDFCIHHKETDHVFLVTHSYWKPTFSNKRYHVKVECILGRNPSFKPKDVIVTMNPSPELVKTVEERFN